MAWFKGAHRGVELWYAVWGIRGVTYNLEVYQTPLWLARWLSNPTYSKVAVLRVGYVVATEQGMAEKKCWSSREGFLEWYEGEKRGKGGG